MKTILAFFIMVFMNQAHAGLFGPSTYDDCILDGVKEAKTDLAVRAVYQSCRNKFPKDLGSNKSPKLDEPCNVYWTGREFKIGSTTGDDSFVRISREYNGIAVVFMAIPKNMAENLGITSMNYGANPADSKKFQNFIDQQWSSVVSLCKLENLKW